MPDETVKAVGFQAVIRLQRDEDAEAVSKLKDGGDAHESADGGDDQPQVADGVTVDRPTVETIEMRRQPRERDGDDNQRNENPATGGIFAPADSQTAASGKGVSDCASQAQNDDANSRRMGKESRPIAPAPNDERKKGQGATDSKSEVLYGRAQRSEGSLELEIRKDESEAFGYPLSVIGAAREDGGTAVRRRRRGDLFRQRPSLEN